MSLLTRRLLRAPSHIGVTYDAGLILANDRLETYLSLVILPQLVYDRGVDNV